MLNRIKNLKSILVRSVVYLGLFLLFIVLYDYLVKAYLNQTEVYLDIAQDKQTEYQLFYNDADGNPEFTEEHSIKVIANENSNLQKVIIALNSNRYTNYRFDLGYLDKVNFRLNKIVIKNGLVNKEFSANEIYSGANTKISYNNIQLGEVKDNQLYFTTTGTDPYIMIKGVNVKSSSNLNIIIALALAFITTLIIYRFVRLRVIYNLFRDLYANRKLIISLASNDFKTKYAGSYFGIVWAFVQPLCTILMFWFVFQVGFRSKPIENVPFVLWLACGLVPWFFFSDAWGSATNSFLDYSYLVKKVVFKISILPIVKVISSLVVHLVFVVFLFFMFFIYKLYPNIYMLQIIYYIFCMCVLVIGLSLITSSLIIFFKDLGQIMNIILQFGMWLTPIMWQTNMIPDQFVWIFKLNPMYYIVQGYRDCMLTNFLFYQNIKQTLYFWCVTLIILLVGSVLFTKSKPHFADVL